MIQSSKMDMHKPDPEEASSQLHDQLHDKGLYLDHKQIKMET